MQVLIPQAAGPLLTDLGQSPPHHPLQPQVCRVFWEFCAVFIPGGLFGPICFLDSMFLWSRRWSICHPVLRFF